MRALMGPGEGGGDVGSVELALPNVVLTVLCCSAHHQTHWMSAKLGRTW